MKNSSNINFIIRNYKKKDYKQIVTLWEETGMGGTFRGDNEKLIDATIAIGGELLVMEKTDSKLVIGTSWLTNDGRRIYLHHFGIKPEYQGRGLSKHLAKESILFAKNKGLQIKLEVHKDNLKALKLYKNFGFKYLGDYDVYIVREFAELYK